MAETIAPRKRSQKEDIFVHHRFYGSYHRSENMVVHSLAEIEKCPTCQKQEERRQKQIVGLQQERQRADSAIDLLRKISLKIHYADEGNDRLIAEIDSQMNIEINQIIIGE